MPVSTRATRPGTPTWGFRAIGVIASALVGGDSIDDADVLRSGRRRRPSASGCRW